MQWDDLRIFLEVARTGSISGAAKRLSVQHSTVSRRMRSLESKLGSRLIERRKSGYELTEAGEELQLSARKIEVEILGFEGAQAGRDNAPVGELRVSAINNMASTVLMPIFARFSDAYPSIEFHVQVTNRFVKLAERDADIAIRLTNSPQETLIGTRLVTVASAVYCSKVYHRAFKSGAEPERWLGVTCCNFHTSWTHEACPSGDHRFYVDDTLLTVSALKSGAGLAYLPCFMGDADPELLRARPPDPRHDLGLWLVYHQDLRRTKRVRLFREHMQREIGAMADIFEGNAACAETATGA